VLGRQKFVLGLTVNSAGSVVNSAESVVNSAGLVVNSAASIVNGVGVAKKNKYSIYLTSPGKLATITFQKSRIYRRYYHW
jgi:hypothetical protein